MSDGARDPYAAVRVAFAAWESERKRNAARCEHPLVTCTALPPDGRTVRVRRECSTCFKDLGTITDVLP